MFKISRKRKRQFIGMCTGVFISAITYVTLSLPQNDSYLSKGPLNTGHENLKCETCHTPAKGNVFQQAQANFMHVVGLRRTEADFGAQNVDNTKCLDCHDRANDRHPLHRFEEPRFAEARKVLGVTECESCHQEHNGVRITQTNIGYCQSCHEDTEMKNDPLEVSHKELIGQKRWNTCLQCHDFHGNHIFHAAESLKDTIPVQEIKDYFAGGNSPYAQEKKYYATTEEELNNKN